MNTSDSFRVAAVRLVLSRAEEWQNEDGRLTDRTWDLVGDVARELRWTTDEIERLRLKADLLDWLLDDPDRCASAIEDAYNQWDGNEPSDWRDILNSEIAFRKLKEKRAKQSSAGNQT